MPFDVDLENVERHPRKHQSDGVRQPQAAGQHSNQCRDKEQKAELSTQPLARIKPGWRRVSYDIGAGNVRIRLRITNG
jgi:hypothetical protein